MVRGVMFKLEFPLAHFGSRDAGGNILFPIIWEAIRHLEAWEFKVLCITADGASPNRKFFTCIVGRMILRLSFTRQINIYPPDNC